MRLAALAACCCFFAFDALLFAGGGDGESERDSPRPFDSEVAVRNIGIVSFAIGMTYALKAAQALAEQGIEAEVIDLRTIRPMDIETIEASVKKTGRCMIVEEVFPQSGVGAETVARAVGAVVSELRRKRDERKAAKKKMAVTDPAGFSKRKLARGEEKKAGRKRKAEERRGGEV